MTPTPDVFSRLDLYTVLHSLPDGVTLANAEGRIVFSNAAADRILGTGAALEASPDEWASHYGVFLPDGETPFPTDRYPLVRAVNGEATRDVEMLVRNPAIPEGALISVSGRPLLDSDGAPIGAAVVFRDITQLRRIQSLKDELTAFIVHDLKSPLTTIIATCDLIATEHGDDTTLIQDVLSVRNAAQRVNRMVLDLLDTQMAEDGALEPARSHIDLVGLLREVRDAALGRMGARDRHRVLVGGAQGLSVHADGDLLFRALVNLVDNCVKYGPDDGRIWIEAAPTENGMTSIAVRDEGPGVPGHLRDRIFEKYAKVEREEGYRSRDSRGLGLRFCRVVVEAHGGRIWVEDAEPTGARFCLELPTGDRG